MIARQVTLTLKPNVVNEFPRTLEKEVLPLLRKQKGFLDQLLFLAPDRKQAVGISLWDQKENVETYQRGTYPQVLKTLEKVVEGTPKVETFDVSLSTMHKLAAA